MKKIRLPLLSLLLLCFAAPSQAFELTVLHTNDVHSMYGGTTEKGTACYAAQCAGGSGGSVRLKQAVDTVRAAEPNVVLLDAGDEFQGPLFYTQFKGDVAAEVLDALDYTAFTPGNHEFDDGCGEFRRFVERTHVPVLVVTAASSCKLLGHIAIGFNDAGIAQRWNGEPIVLDGRNVTVPPDAKLSARLDSYAAQLRSLIGQPVGKILLAGDTSGRQVDLEEDAHLCRVQECPSGDVLMDSLLWGARDTGATVALSVGGTVRSSLHTGVVTMGDLLTTMPFDNTLVVGDLTGKQLLGALEHGASGYENGAGRFLQVAGLTYSV